MTDITFLQVRPAETVNEIWASTRRREGTLAVEVVDPGPDDVEAAARGGLLLASGDPGVTAPAYIVPPHRLGRLRKGDIEGWRITILDVGTPMDVLDAVAFTRAGFVRTGRSSVSSAVALVDRPGLDASVSVLVDTVGDAVAALELCRAAREAFLLNEKGTLRLEHLAMSLPAAA